MTKKLHLKFRISSSTVFSRGHATLNLAVLVGESVTFLNCERFSHYCSCLTVCDWIAVYLAVFFAKPRTSNVDGGLEKDRAQSLEQDHPSLALVTLRKHAKAVAGCG